MGANDKLAAALHPLSVEDYEAEHTLPDRPRRAPRYRLTEDEKHQAAILLDDGASFRDVARTLGRSASAICRAFPGRGWTTDQVAERASLDRRFRGVL